jgi:hypothetical protein
MPHKITVLDSGIVEIVHTGLLTLREATASRDEAAPMMKERGLNLVLADVSQADHTDSTMDLFNFNASHYDVFLPGTLIAVVIPPDPAKAESARFAETVATNRGIAMRIFLEYDAALNWLARTLEG